MPTGEPPREEAGTSHTPVSLHVIWEPRDMLDLRLMRALDALIDRSGIDGMTDPEIDAALEYYIVRRKLLGAAS